MAFRRSDCNVVWRQSIRWMDEIQRLRSTWRLVQCQRESFPPRDASFKMYFPHSLNKRAVRRERKPRLGLLAWLFFAPTSEQREKPVTGLQISPAPTNGRSLLFLVLGDMPVVFIHTSLCHFTARSRAAAANGGRLPCPLALIERLRRDKHKVCCQFRAFP